MGTQAVSVALPGSGAMAQRDTLCRDCGLTASLPIRETCPDCGSHRIIQHPELARLSLAHIDCDAFYASIEKRDTPDLLHKPVIVGGGKRGVVATACYVARINGVRSAMPMFKALALCPDAVVIKPRMQVYRDAGMRIRTLMRELTPLVEPLSIDEAFLDMTGTERLHGKHPAASLADLAHRVKRDIGVTISIGLAANKSMAKIASDQDKPNGFHIIGGDEAAAWLAEKPVSILYGAGKALVRKLNDNGLRTCGEVAAADARTVMMVAGEIGPRLQERAAGIDHRKVIPDEAAKSISSETTFDVDIEDRERLLAWLLTLSEKVSSRLKQKELAGKRVVLKLKTADFKLITRSVTLMAPTRMSEQIFSHGSTLLEKEIGRGKRWRLIGIGVETLTDLEGADPPDLADPDRDRRHRLEQAMDKVRDRHGGDKIIKGRRLGLDGDETGK